jgi:hypothetical protein
MQPPALHRPPKFLSAAAAILSLALVLAGGLTIASVGLASQPATAASYGAGYSDASTGSVFGNFVLPDGSKGYCIDPGADVPTGATADAGITTNLVSVGANGSHSRNLSTNEVAGINHIVTKYGQTDDNNTAAAVALTIWSIANAKAFAEETAPYGDNYKMTLAPSSQRAAIASLAARFRAEAAGYSAPASVAGQASLRLTTNSTNHSEGSLVIDALSARASGRITLTNGIFVANNSPSIVGIFSAGEVLAFTAAPTASSASYSVSAELALTGGESASSAADLHLWVSGSKQKLVSAGSKVTLAFAATASDPYPRAATFQPIATTKAANVWLKQGDDLVDLIQPTTAPDASGRNNPWPKDSTGGYLPVVFSNTAYGPFPEKPLLSEHVPAGAPIAGTATFTTAGTGPTTSYRTTMPKAVTTSGYYTFVVSVQYTDQAAATQAFLPGPVAPTPGPRYAWADSFAHEDETGFAFPTATTEAQPLTSPLGTVIDSVTVEGQVPAEGLDVTFAGYLQPAGSTVPLCDETTLAYSSSTPTAVDTAGTYASETFAVPAASTSTRTGTGTGTSTGTIYWVATTVVRGTDIVVSTGVCGDATEQTVVAQPVISTTPPATAVTGTTVHDIVTVQGWVAAGSTTVVSLYKQSAGATALTCDSSTLVAALPALAIAEGLNSATAYVTAETAKLGAGHYGFVQQTLDREGGIVSTGGCQEELFRVVTPTPLAKTGSDQLEGAWLLGGLGGLLATAGIALAAIGFIRHRRADRR